MKSAWCLLAWLGTLAAARVASSGDKAAPAGEGTVYALRALRGTLTAACGEDMAPDRAVIVGGVTARSLKPTEARVQIEKQIEVIRQYVAGKGGRLHLGETVRAVRPLPPEPSRPPEDVLPFVLVQRLEAEFEVGAPIDEILEGLLQRGLDQYGRDLRLEAMDASPKVVVRYRLSNLAKALDALHDRCRALAWEQWCETNVPPEERAGCARAFPSVSRHLVTNALSLQSQPILHEHGGSAPLQLHYPWDRGQIEGIELLGQTPLRLRGTITLTGDGGRIW